jgi:hypothetical protein
MKDMEPKILEPEQRFPQPTNSKVLAILKANATPLAPQAITLLVSRRSRMASPQDDFQMIIDPYHPQTHPDLGARLYELAKPLPEDCRAVLFGCPVLVSRKGIVFAVARGTNTLAFRLSLLCILKGFIVGAKPALKYGLNWIEVDGWPQGNEIAELRRWCKQAYEKAR